MMGLLREDECASPYGYQVWKVTWEAWGKVNSRLSLFRVREEETSRIDIKTVIVATMVLTLVCSSVRLREARHKLEAYPYIGFASWSWALDHDFVVFEHNHLKFLPHAIPHVQIQLPQHHVHHQSLESPLSLISTSKSWELPWWTWTSNFWIGSNNKHSRCHICLRQQVRMSICPDTSSYQHVIQARSSSLTFLATPSMLRWCSTLQLNNSRRVSAHGSPVVRFFSFRESILTKPTQRGQISWSLLLQEMPPLFVFRHI